MKAATSYAWVIVMATTLAGCVSMKWTPLHEAVDQGNTEEVGRLVESGAEVNALGRKPQTGELLSPFQLAVSKGDKGLVRLLLSKGANPVDGVGAAVCSKNAELVETCLVACKKDTKGQAARRLADSLVIAARQGDSAVVEAFLEHGIGPDVQGEPLGAKWTPSLLGITPISVESALRPSTPLYWAVIGGNTDTVKVLLEHGASVNIVSDTRVYATDQYYFLFGHMSPLHWAVLTQNREMVELLLNHGASANTEGGAVIIRRLSKDIEAQGLAGALAETIVNAKYTIPSVSALHLAVCTLGVGSDSTVELYFDPAKEEVSKEIVKLLLAHGASVNATAGASFGPGQQTPADWAEKIGNTEAVKLLRKTQ